MTKVSIIIATYECGDLIRVTLNSIRMGGWTNLEVIVIDGASGDETLAPVEDFPDLPISVTSEPDKGQYDAINKGMAQARGEISCWINAGDFFLPGAIGNAVAAFDAFPEMMWLTGRQCVAEAGAIRKMAESVLRVSEFEIRLGLCTGRLGGHLQQEGMFWRHELWEKAGPLDLRYKLAADFELWTRFSQHAMLYRAKIPLAAFSYHETNRSITEAGNYEKEVGEAVQRLPQRLQRVRRCLLFAPRFWRICRRVPLVRELSAMVFRCIHPLHIKLIVFQKKGGTFLPVCKTASAWVK